MIWATITDKYALRDIKEQRVLDYLDERGWIIRHEVQYGYIIEHPKFRDDEDNSPITIHLAKHTAGDYVRRLAETLQTLSIVEDRSQLDIFVDMGGSIE